MSTHSTRSSRFRPLLCLLATGAVLAIGSTGRSEDENQAPNPSDQPLSLSERAQTAYLQLPALINAKDYDGALRLLEGAKAVAAPDSYDRAVIESSEGAIYFQGKQNPTKALEAWEIMLSLAKAHPNYFSAAEVREHYMYAAQIYLTKGSDTKDLVARREDYAKARADIEIYFKGTPNPKSDTILFYASLLYFTAVLDPKHIDVDLIRKAEAQTRLALELSVNPNESLYQLIIAELQQQGNLPQAAKYFELLVKQHPTNKTYWQQLMAIYYNLAATNDKDLEKRKQFYARAINVMERAGKLGYLNSTKDNYDLVSLYTQVGQYGKATELLHDGLQSGHIANTVENWLFLSSFYQQIDQNAKAIAVLKEADERFPGTGEFDRQIAQINYETENTKGVYEYTKLAAAKGNLKAGHGYAVYQLLSFSAYELGKYQEALDAIDKAMTFRDAPKSLARLREGILNAIEVEKTNKAAVLGKPL